MDEYEVPKLIPMTLACSDMLAGINDSEGCVFSASDF